MKIENQYLLDSHVSLFPVTMEIEGDVWKCANLETRHGCWRVPDNKTFISMHKPNLARCNEDIFIITFAFHMWFMCQGLTHHFLFPLNFAFIL